MSKILNPSQARALYDAACALNNVSSASGIELSLVGSDDDGLCRLTFAENAAGEVVVFRGPAMSRNVKREVYDSQAAFAAAYGLA